MPAPLRATIAAPDSNSIATTVAQAIQQDRRLRVLAVLTHAPARLCNEHALKSALLSLGHATTSDLMRTELAWLAEQGLIELDRTGSMHVARLLPRGADVALGAAQQPGIAPPAA